MSTKICIRAKNFCFMSASKLHIFEIMFNPPPHNIIFCSFWTSFSSWTPLDSSLNSWFAWRFFSLGSADSSISFFLAHLWAERCVEARADLYSEITPWPSLYVSWSSDFYSLPSSNNFCRSPREFQPKRREMRRYALRQPSTPADLHAFPLLCRELCPLGQRLLR